MSRQERAGGSNRGFTLIELLVVIAIIGVLVAILLPAVQQARETANRSRCANNLKQLGIALYAYEESHSRLPFGALEQRGIGPSWQVALLPYLDQAALYDRFAMTGSNVGSPTFPGSPNAALVNKKTLPAVWCPSSAIPQFQTTVGITVQMSSYAGIAGATNEDGFQVTRVTPCCAGNSNDGQISGDGTLIPNSAVRLADLTDGASNVMVIGESSGFGWIPGGIRRIDASYSLGWCAGTSAVGTPPSLTPPGTATMPPSSYNITTIRYPPNTLFFQSGTSVAKPGIRESLGPNNPLSSAHTGGVQVLIGDGAVTYISDNIDLLALKRMACRDDGKPVEFPR